MDQQKDPKTGELEGLSFDFNLCESLATWEQVSGAIFIFFVSLFFLLCYFIIRINVFLSDAGLMPYSLSSMIT